MGGCVQSQPQEEPLPENTFRATHISVAGARLWKARIQILDAKLVVHRLDEHGRIDQEMNYPLKFVRRYGFQKEFFTLEVGRKCETGQGRYVFELRRAECLFNMVQDRINALMNQLAAGESLPDLVPQVHGASSLSGCTVNNNTFTKRGLHQSSRHDGFPLVVDLPAYSSHQNSLKGSRRQKRGETAIVDLSAFPSSEHGGHITDDSLSRKYVNEELIRGQALLPEEHGSYLQTAIIAEGPGGGSSDSHIAARFRQHQRFDANHLNQHQKSDVVVRHRPGFSNAAYGEVHHGTMVGAVASSVSSSGSPALHNGVGVLTGSSSHVRQASLSTTESDDSTKRNSPSAKSKSRAKPNVYTGANHAYFTSPPVGDSGGLAPSRDQLDDVPVTSSSALPPVVSAAAAGGIGARTATTAAQMMMATVPDALYNCGADLKRPATHPSTLAQASYNYGSYSDDSALSPSAIQVSSPTAAAELKDSDLHYFYPNQMQDQFDMKGTPPSSAIASGLPYSSSHMHHQRSTSASSPPSHSVMSTSVTSSKGAASSRDEQISAYAEVDNEMTEALAKLTELQRTKQLKSARLMNDSNERLSSQSSLTSAIPYTHHISAGAAAAAPRSRDCLVVTSVQTVSTPGQGAPVMSNGVGVGSGVLLEHGLSRRRRRPNQAQHGAKMS